MFTKEQLKDAMLHFTKKAHESQYKSKNDNQVTQITNQIANMRSVCSTGKREVAELVSLIIGKTVGHRPIVDVFDAYSIRIHPVSKAYVIVGKSGDTFYGIGGNTISNSSWIKQTVVAESADVSNCANFIWKAIEDYTLFKSFVQILNTLVNTHIKLVKEELA